MNTKRLNWAAMALMPAAILTFTSCSSTDKDKGGAEATPKGGTTEAAAYVQEGVPGGIVVETYKSTATVTSIDPASRKLTMVTPDGTKSKYTAGPEIANFNQIQVGDQVKATLTKQVAVSLLEPGATRSPGETSVVALAPKGAKPGAVMADTVEATARIEALDLKKRKATLMFPDGKKKTYDVRPDVDMTKAHLGQQVLIRVTEAVAIRVEKP